MNEDRFIIEISGNDWQVIFALSCATLGFMAYQSITEKKRLAHQKNSNGYWPANTRLIFFQRLYGVLFFGLMPLLANFFFKLNNLNSLGLGFQNFEKSLFWLAVIFLPIVIFNYMIANKPANLAKYPQINARQWTPGILALSGLSWLAYLLAYEFLFRGVLLLPVASVLGPAVAIAINVAVYALVHLPKGMAEVVASIPFGLVLCFITLSTGTIWAAFLLHAALALTNEWLSIYRHPDMKFVKSNKS